ncbi:hypothetical protein AX17_003821 [Amanita inopinata Kibby_2008]|nr:hypothetical protein AX17_003821 [Amanita inopinata Kibby_2008]
MRLSYIFSRPIWIGLSLLTTTAGSVTVYHQPGQQPFGTGTNGVYTGPAAYNPTTLVPPPVPTADFAGGYEIQLTSNKPPAGISIPQIGSFIGFSVEMSVVNQVFGKGSQLIEVPFLNLMSNLVKRSGQVNIRVGGNTQEMAVLVDKTPSGRLLEKDQSAVIGTTRTPPLLVSKDLLYMMKGISDLVNVRWFLGIPFNDTQNWRLSIASEGQRILGDYLIGLQAGNEPDLYARHHKRPPNYSVHDYFKEFKSLVNAIANDDQILDKQMLIGPSLATGAWHPEDVWNTGYVDAFSSSLRYLAMEHYPTDNCYAQFGVGTPRDAQKVFPSFLNHNAGINLISLYLNSTRYAQEKGKKFLMFETNTASCGGFPGLSDSFGAALWGLDYALQLAYSNFSMGLFHIGGQGVYYNKLSAPPTNQSTYHQWSIGPIYYTSLIMAEILGPSNASQVMDMWNVDKSISMYTPAYVIYENGSPTRVALFNFVSDPSGNSDINVTISMGGRETGQPKAAVSEVRVKYLRANSISQKGNFTWAGQTFGDYFASDGRFTGAEDIQTVPCDQERNLCIIRVPGPSFALVFLTDKAIAEVSGGPFQTFSTSVITKTVATATFDPAVLATSNGHGGTKRLLGSTSRGSLSGAVGPSHGLPGVRKLGAIVGVVVVLGKMAVGMEGRAHLFMN